MIQPFCGQAIKGLIYFVTLRFIFANMPALPDISFYEPNIVLTLFQFTMFLLLLCGSALISASEAGYFSLTPAQLKLLSDSEIRRDQLALQLINKPERLLANILITNNFINITIVLLSAYIINSLVNFTNAPLLGFIVQVVVITSVLLFVCEIIPKIFATEHNIIVVRFMSWPLNFLSYILYLPASILLLSTSVVQKRLGSIKPNLSVNDLSNALELTGEALKEEKSILKGIVKFGNTEVSEIMLPRMDIVAVDKASTFGKLLSVVVESGYSRLPIYEGNPDNITGILLTKDLLPYIGEKNSFHWQGLAKPAYFIPETKKIDDLLAEFQKNKTHLAIVIDEYGGTCGLVTMEDILEEVIGEISDETDIDEVLPYKRLSENTYLFEAKVQLNDFYKITGVDDCAFDDLKGEYETLAGLLLELKGEIPQRGQKLTYKNFTFFIESADKRRIKQIKVIIK